MGSETSPVKAARKALDLRLVDVALKADMSIGHISMIEHGYEPSAKTKVKLAGALETTPEHLWPEPIAA